MGDDKSNNDDKAMSDEQFDQTNGLAGNLEGDDGGAEVPESPEDLKVIPNLLADPHDEYDQDGQDRGYSEEGRD